MTRITLFLLTLFALSSCKVVVRFNEPQPKKGVRQFSFPEELQGTWTDDSGESLTIEEDYTVTDRIIMDSLGNVIDTTLDYSFLSDSLQLYQSGSYYVYNQRFNSGAFNIVVVKIDPQGNINYFYCDDPNLFNDMRGLKADSASFYVVDYFHENTDSLIIKPTKKHFEKSNFVDVNWVYYSGQLREKDLKKICKKEYLVISLKSDGTMFAPESEEAEE